ncbi:MAG: hypothetical protein N2692_00630 [Patescibacteria group bacterium]|nr:hypothetical protein [Patescibacteria group bacterium]
MSLVLGPAVSVFAQTVATANTPQPKDLGTWLGVVKTVFRWIYTIILVISVGLGLYAAFLYLTSGGDAGKVKQASKYLIYAIIGLVVAVLAFSITSIVGSLINEQMNV